MTGRYQYTIGQERIAELHREAERERLAASASRTETGRVNRLARLRGRLVAARVSTT